MPVNSSFIMKAQYKCMFRLIRNAEQINSGAGHEEKIKGIRRLYKTNSLRIRNYDNSILMLKDTMIWGYQFKDCTLYRNFSHDFYEVEQIGSVIIYSLESKGYRGRLIKSYYKSKDFNAPLIHLDKTDIEEQFKQNLKDKAKNFQSSLQKDSSILFIYISRLPLSTIII